MFVGSVGLSHRGRDAVERRFQNPGSNKPIEVLHGRDPLLLGLWDDDSLIPRHRPLLVSADPVRRTGHLTRFSVFASVTALETALETGWEEDQSATDETIRCFVPSLLPLSYQADRFGVSPPPLAMQTAIEGSGLLNATPAEVAAVAQRARRAGSTLVRDARFSRRVIDAYDGKCAMCGLTVGLVQGAHIHPVSAPGSHDEPWNGLALCANHHVAFDKHLVAVRPHTLEIVIHETILDQTTGNPAVRSFVDGTFERLAHPRDPAARPAGEMFEKRYEHFADHYVWAAA